MARKHHKPEEIVAKLQQVEVLVGQGKPVAEGVRAIGVTEATYYRWRAEYGGLKLDQVRRLKVLEQENGHLRRAVCMPKAGLLQASRTRARPTASRATWDQRQETPELRTTALARKVRSTAIPARPAAPYQG